MDPTIIASLITGVIAVILTKLWDSIREWTRGRKDEAQRIAGRLETMTSRVNRLETLLEATRQLALRKGASYEELPKDPNLAPVRKN